MKDIGRKVFIPELGAFGTVIKQRSDGRIVEVQLSSKFYERNAISNIPIPTIITVVDLSVIVIKGVITLIPIIKEIIKLITDGK